MHPLSAMDNLTIGPRCPRVVGTVSSLECSEATLRRLQMEADIAELRVDLIGPTEPWPQMAMAIRAAGRPLLLTVRIQSEGGRWNQGEQKRRALIEKALPLISGLDLELSSVLAPSLGREILREGKFLLISYHNFDRTPGVGELTDVITQAAKLGSAVKVTTMVRAYKDIRTLQQILKLPWQVPLCLMGMGPLGAITRTFLPALGSCLTYGYLDHPVAPGQPAATTLLRQLSRNGVGCPASRIARLFPGYNS